MRTVGGSGVSFTLENIRGKFVEETIDIVYFSGNNGLIFKGNRNRWQSVGSHDLDDKFWDMELYENKLYLAHAKGIVVYDGRHLQEIDFGLGGHIACHKLHAADGVLWSFGIDDLLVFDGNR